MSAMAHLSFLTSRPAIVLQSMLVLQTAVFYALPRRDVVPQVRPLNEVADNLAGWRLLEEGVMEEEVQENLRPDDYLSRTYLNPVSGRQASIFVALFRTQRVDRLPHTPRNCLPGNGWMPVSHTYIDAAVAAEPGSIRINRYLVRKGDTHQLALYWYQAASGAIASEYMAKIRLVLDSVRYHRTDTALVRIVVPLSDVGDTTAQREAVAFVAPVYQFVRERVPAP